MIDHHRIVSEYCESNGGREVHRSWLYNMLTQKRAVVPERMQWDTLEDRDKKLDIAIAGDVIRDFLAWLG